MPTMYTSDGWQDRKVQYNFTAYQARSFKKPMSKVGNIADRIPLSHELLAIDFDTPTHKRLKKEDIKTRMERIITIIDDLFSMKPFYMSISHTCTGAHLYYSLSKNSILFIAEEIKKIEFPDMTRDVMSNERKIRRALYNDSFHHFFVNNELVEISGLNNIKVAWEEGKKNKYNFDSQAMAWEIEQWTGKSIFANFGKKEVKDTDYTMTQGNRVDNHFRLAKACLRKDKTFEEFVSESKRWNFGSRDLTENTVRICKGVWSQAQKQLEKSVRQSETGVRHHEIDEKTAKSFIENTYFTDTVLDEIIPDLGNSKVRLINKMLMQNVVYQYFCKKNILPKALLKKEWRDVILNSISVSQRTIKNICLYKGFNFSDRYIRTIQREFCASFMEQVVLPEGMPEWCSYPGLNYTKQWNIKPEVLEKILEALEKFLGSSNWTGKIKERIIEYKNSIKTAYFEIKSSVAQVFMDLVYLSSFTVIRC